MAVMNNTIPHCTAEEDRKILLNSIRISYTAGVLLQSIATTHWCCSANHSCEPNVAVDLSSANPANWHVRVLKDIEAGCPSKSA